MVLEKVECLFSPFTAWLPGSVTVLQALPFVLSHGSRNQSNIDFSMKQILPSPINYSVVGIRQNWDLSFELWYSILPMSQTKT
jgi:hypothetical protein